jgi:transcription elongation GreA/GreB family factor
MVYRRAPPPGGPSVESPLARTLLEQKEGDEVEVPRPRGVATARLVRVE